MYKKRLRLWQLRKNYTQEQKSRALEKVDKALNEQCLDRANSALLVNGKPLVFEHIWRDIQRDRRPLPLVTGRRRGDVKLIHCKAKPSHKEGGTRLMPLLRSPGPLHPSINVSSEEQMLWHANCYFSAYATLRGVQPDYSWGDGIARMSKFLRFGRNLLKEDTRQGFAMINIACSHVQALMQAQPLSLLVELMLTFRHTTWSGFERARNAVLGFIQASASEILGPQHPITQVVAYTRTEHIGLILAMKLQEIEVAMVEWLLRNNDFETYLDIKLFALSSLINEGMLDAAGNLCSQALQEIQSKLPRDHRVSRHILSDLAAVRHYQGDYLGAETLYLEVAQKTLTGTPETLWDREDVYACEGLGDLYWALQRYDESQMFLQLALKAALSFGGWEAQAAYWLRKLERLLLLLGKEQELIQLRADYAWVWKIIEAWQLC